METITIIALLIFVPTYILISVRNLKLFVLERYTVVLFGAALMVVLGVVSASDALDAIDLNTLALLLGMMLMVVGLEFCGFFTWVSVQIMRRSKDQLHLMVLVMVTTAVLSALILNDAVVLLFTPIVIRTCRVIGANPVPYLIAEAVSANIGSVATPVGNPQNAFIAVRSGLTFNQFFFSLAPVAIISLVVAMVLILYIFRKDLTEEVLGENGRKRSKLIDPSCIDDEMSTLNVHRSIYVVLAILAMVFLGFVLSSDIGIPLALIALIGGSAVLFVLPLINPRADAQEMVRKVDWTLLLFFIGLFVLLKGVETSGLLDAMLGEFETLSGDGVGSVMGLTAFSAILSNLISNVPAVMLLTPLIPSTGSDTLWLTLAGSSTLAGNATILGAAANVIVVEKASSMGIEVSFWQFLKVGMPITIITLLLMTFMLSL
jgi:Na+/H+ antiporter NhaD/arsenite permease-like protein